MTDPLPPSTFAILAAVVARLNSKDALVALVGKAYNHIPQERALPCLRVRYVAAQEWDTKDSAGYNGTIQVDVWTDHRGDAVALQAADLITAALHLQPLDLGPDQQSLILRRNLVDAFTEPDGITHHTVVRFDHITTT